MLGLEAQRGGVRLSAQLGPARMAGLSRQTSRGYLLPSTVSINSCEWVRGGGPS